MTSTPTKRETVKLISAEGFEFLIDYRAACVSATIKNMLSSQGDGSLTHPSSYATLPIDSCAGFPISTNSSIFAACICCLVLQGLYSMCTMKLCWCSAGSFTETELGEIRFPEISTAALEKACQYFYYKLKWANA